MSIIDNNDGAITAGLRRLRGEAATGDVYQQHADNSVTKEPALMSCSEGYAWVGFFSGQAQKVWRDIFEKRAAEVFNAFDPAHGNDATVVIQSRLHEKDEPGEFTTGPLRYSYIELKQTPELMERIDRELNEELFPAMK